jgi:hypothetical protein
MSHVNPGSEFGQARSRELWTKVEMTAHEVSKSGLR